MMPDPHDTPSPPPPGHAPEQTPLPGASPAEATRPRTSVWFASLGLDTGAASRIEPPDPHGPPPEPAPDPEPGTVVCDRYELRRKVGQGGMAVVYAATDRYLDRKVAVKLVRHDPKVRPQDRRAAFADLARRFAQEARITCQLQHPGIPPVHEVGQLPDGRPFMVMKLVKGNTLAEMLKSRFETAGGTTPLGAASDLPEYLQHFEKVCQTVEYAHSKGVVHRDLDPRNVMVGAFGEVQVMDWGLALVLDTPADPDSLADEEVVDGTVIDPGRGVGTDQSDGAVGKFWYMPPEQAAGDRVDRRSDVFALGSILCEVLTGQPPYTARMIHEARREALLWHTDPAFARLDRCSADPELIALVKRCLARLPDDRPADAAAVAQEVGNFRAGVAARLRQAELDRTAAEARAAAEGRAKRVAIEAAEHQKWRRRMQLGFIGTASVLVLVVVAGLWWNEHKTYLRQLADEKADSDRKLKEERDLTERRTQARAETERDVTVALDDAHARLTEAAGLVADPVRWGEAIKQAERATLRARFHLGKPVLVGAEPDPATVRAVEDVATKVTQAEKDRVLVARLDRIADHIGVQHARGGQMGKWYQDAFRDYGLDLADAAATAEALGTQVRQSRFKEIILVALTDWWETLGSEKSEPRTGPDRGRVEKVISAALDRDWVIGRWRAARNDPAKVAVLLTSLDPSSLHPREIEYLVGQLRQLDLDGPALDLLRRGIDRHPDDVRLRLRFAEDVSRLPPNALEDAVTHTVFVLYRRPESVSAHLFLGNARFRLRRFDEAARSYRRALMLAKDDPVVLAKLGETMLEKAKADPGDRAALTDAVTHLSLAARNDPEDYRVWYNLATAELMAGNLAAAEAAFDKANQYARETWAWGFVGIADVRFSRGDYAAASAALVEARKRDPRNPGVRFGLGRELHRQKKYPDAAVEFRIVLETTPDHPEAWLLRGDCLRCTGQPDQGLTCVRRAVALNPRSPRAVALLIDSLAGRDFHAETARAYAALAVADPGLVRRVAWAEAGSGATAARVALSAGLGQGFDIAPPEEQRLFRRRSLDWLQCDLLLWAEKLACDPACGCVVSAAMKDWLNDPSFAAARDVGSVLVLPAAEVDEWQRLWDEVRALRDRAEPPAERIPPPREGKPKND